MYNFIFDESGDFSNITHETNRDGYVVIAGILVLDNQMPFLQVAADRLYLRYSDIDLEKFHLTDIRKYHKHLVEPILNEVKNILTNIGAVIYFQIDSHALYIEQARRKYIQKKN